jgi:hypothetical protein
VRSWIRLSTWRRSVTSRKVQRAHAAQVDRHGRSDHLANLARPGSDRGDLVVEGPLPPDAGFRPVAVTAVRPDSQLERGLSDRLLSRIAENSQELLVDVEHTTRLDLADNRRNRARVKGKREALLRLPQGFLGALALGNVVEQSDEVFLLRAVGGDGEPDPQGIQEDLEPLRGSGPGHPAIVSNSSGLDSRIPGMTCVTLLPTTPVSPVTFSKVALTSR